MGRKKREIKRIEDKSCMQVAFCKRRKGLIKKAKELSILCDAEVALLVFSNRGRLHDFSSTNSVPGTIQRYEDHHKPEEISAKVQDTQQSKYSSFMTTGELLQTIERQVEETDVDCVSVTDLVHLENQLETAIIRIRSRKTHMMLEFVRDLHEKEKMLRKENKVLEEEAEEKMLRKENKVLEEKMANLAPFQQKVTLNLL